MGLSMELAGPVERPRVEERVIEGCRRGERSAYRALYDAYADSVYTLALAYFHGDAARAEDAAQETFLRVFAAIGRFRGSAAFSTWLYRIAVNVCVDEERRHRRLAPMEAAADAAAPATAEPHRCAQASAERDAVRAAIASLAPPIRAAVALRYYEEMSYDELARALGCSKGTVASRLNRGLKALARKLAHLNDSGDV